MSDGINDAYNGRSMGVAYGAAPAPEPCCLLCHGRGEVEIEVDGERDCFGCPKCVAAERDAELAWARQRIAAQDVELQSKDAVIGFWRSENERNKAELAQARARLSGRIKKA